MHNYHFKIANAHSERNVYIRAESYNDALDILFKENKFFTYEFQGVKE